MKAVNLSKIALDDYPDLVSALLDGRVRLYFVMVAHARFSFLEQDGHIWNSRDGIYEVIHPKQVARDLQTRYRGTDHGGISLPHIKDDQGNELCVIHSDEDFVDHEGKQCITLVRFPYDQFQVEWMEPFEKTKEPRSPAALLVTEYLAVKPTGNLPGLRTWAADQYGASKINRDGKRHLRWIDPLGDEQIVPEKTISNLLSKHHKKPA